MSSSIPHSWKVLDLSIFLFMPNNFHLLNFHLFYDSVKNRSFSECAWMINYVFHINPLTVGDRYLGDYNSIHSLFHECFD